MIKSIAIGAGLLAGLSATAVGAVTPIPAKYFGSDTLFVVTQSAITNDPALTGQANNYLAGGSGAGEGNMNVAVAANALQETAPMSRMLSSKVCTFGGGTAGSLVTNASGVVIAMDAVDIMAATQTGGGGASLCTSPGTVAGQTTDGIAFSGTGGVFSGTTSLSQNWKWILALLYGGLDYSQPTPTVDCNSVARKNLVSNWSKLFQNGCQNNAGAGVCSDVEHLTGANLGTCSVGGAECFGLGAVCNGTGVCNAVTTNGALPAPLWHAFRRDDASGTSDVFSSLLGLTKLYPSTSASGNNGFGASPYCNALNWDTNSLNTCNTSVGLGKNDQWVGPGGVVDPLSTCIFKDFPTNGTTGAETCAGAGTGNHHRPPPGTWGDHPAVPAVASADVLPTSFQDNDPIRRTCINQTHNRIGVPTFSGEEVCNTDGTLGVVLAIPSSDFIPDQLSLEQYPATPCNGAFAYGGIPQVLKCAPLSANTHNGACPNGDLIAGGGCQMPVLSVATGLETAPTTQCINHTDAQSGSTSYVAGATDARSHNLFMADASLSSLSYIQLTIQNGKTTPPVVDFAGGMGRLHANQAIWGSTATRGSGAQSKDATDQIAALVQADPCSVGYAGDGGKTWNQRPVGSACQILADKGICTGSGTPPATCTISPAACPADAAPYSGANCPAACTSGSAVTESVRIAGTYPTSGNVTALGKQQIEYEVGRKLYFNSIIGFQNVANTGADPGGAGELELGNWESNSYGTHLTPILNTIGYFPLANQSNATFNAPFCEDFNQQTVCGAASNDNACARNNTGVTGIPSDPSATATAATTSTVCGNGIIEAYEECDNGTSNGTSGNTCSATCRCAGANVYKSGGTLAQCSALNPPQAAGCFLCLP